MAWAEPDMFDEVGHGNKPFAMRIPALLVTKSKDGLLNFLTAMWFTPVGFEPSRMIVAVSKSTLTNERLHETGEFVMAAPSRQMMDYVVMAGRVSGRDADKWAETGLTPVKAKHISVPLIAEAIGNVEYRVHKVMPFDDKTDLFVGEALAAYMRKGCMEGDLYKDDSDPLLYLGTKYDENGKSLGKHYAEFSGVKCANYDSPLLKKYITRR
ncbi:MAG TPA: flavin reductase family protein [Alphaproteobacteria bacterium]|jgi:flavin reductase (DIM6/NTAB) family NADH-FMN oxidoreductase RutF